MTDKISMAALSAYAERHEDRELEALLRAVRAARAHVHSPHHAVELSEALDAFSFDEEPE